jgi:hypothetical protein
MVLRSFEILWIVPKTVVNLFRKFKGHFWRHHGRQYLECNSLVPYVVYLEGEKHSKL